MLYVDTAYSIEKHSSYRSGREKAILSCDLHNWDLASDSEHNLTLLSVSQEQNRLFSSLLHNILLSCIRKKNILRNYNIYFSVKISSSNFEVSQKFIGILTQIRNFYPLLNSSAI